MGGAVRLGGYMGYAVVCLGASVCRGIAQFSSVRGVDWQEPGVPTALVQCAVSGFSSPEGRISPGCGGMEGRRVTREVVYGGDGCCRGKGTRCAVQKER